jgi:hypothetical protein
MALLVIGADSREALRKLLRSFVYRDLAATTPDDRSAIAQYLVSLIATVTQRLGSLIVHPESSRPGRPMKAAPDPRAHWVADLDELREVQSAVRRAVVDIAASDSHSAPACRMELFAFRSDDPSSAGSRRLMLGMDLPLPEAAMFATLLLMTEVPENVLRVCPYLVVEEEGPTRTRVPCRAVFVATKRQKFCDEHCLAARRDRDRRAQKQRRRKKKAPPRLRRDVPTRA